MGGQAGGRREQRRGAAGRQGEDIRSDLWVEIEPAPDGAHEIDLDSRVEPYYGASLRSEVSALLRRLGLPHARVRIVDRGALPFVVAARVAAAALRAGVESADAGRPERTAPLPPPSTRDRLRRSRLYLPGTEPKFMINAGLHRPDAVILDLEDSVHPDDKDAARLLVRNALAAVDFGAAERTVRINQLPLGLDDLRAVVPELPDLILIPKVEDPAQVEAVDATITQILRAESVERPLWLMPILESALGVERAFEIARASTRVAALTLGLEDYAADLGLPKSEDGEESLYARTRVVNAARAAGVAAIDSVYGQVDDTDGLKRWGERSKRLGFTGMGCVHPRQIRVIHEAYRPAPQAIERALAIVEAWEQARAAGRGVVSLGSKMIDPPVVRQAARLVEQARELGLLGPGARGERS